MRLSRKELNSLLSNSRFVREGSTLESTAQGAEVPSPRAAELAARFMSVQKVLGGANGKHVSLYTKIPYNTLMRTVRQTKAGSNKAPERRGPKPQGGHPPDRHDILVKANKLAREFDPLQSLTDGWYTRFRQRHPELTVRSAQVISHARNFVDMDGVNRLFESMKTAVADHALTPDRIFIAKYSGAMYTISKRVALRIASRAWTSLIVPTNVIKNGGGHPARQLT
ncbi:hypothetical protein H257_10444 [Aphanomyces astaci]|uniref:HTH CENPB-type domain-containing protein n=1 Tax=Aphanomyces astaci TaxID=112090 RepID=W4G6A0_APHAT|nr:hypothetical protein H257_10444 [Aphanomyces astaci]ETV75252.1 hypothetical protein H257_10444 [Aphanomyces astaci]|eukprot:XP_009835300.1 hypothetical protein H257_10444 [Aphanomyces astaci]